MTTWGNTTACTSGPAECENSFVTTAVASHDSPRDVPLAVRFVAPRDDSPGGVPLRPPFPLRSTCPMGLGSTVSPTVFWFTLRFLCVLRASALRNPAPRNLAL